MASTRKSISVSVEGVVAMAAVLLLLQTSAWAGVDAADFCPSEPLVYPFWSTCWYPAMYWSPPYSLRPVGNWTLGLAPEWDETNSTYYVRLSDEPANYTLWYLTREYRFAVAQQENLFFVNEATNRSLGWRQEGDEYFLIEEAGTLQDQAEVLSGMFQFVQDGDVLLPCPRIASARCEAYNVLSSNSSTAASAGLSPYEEDGAVYFKLSSDQMTPFVLIKSQATTSNRLASPNVKLATEI